MRRVTLGKMRRSRFSAGWHRPSCDRFERLGAWAFRTMGGRWGFRVASMVFIAWAMSGHYFDYSEAWKFSFFIGNSSVTFLTVFLARNAQIRSAKALHVKLDALIYAVKRADNGVIESEELAETELDRMRGRYHRLAQAAVAVRSTNHLARAERRPYRPASRTAGRSVRAARDAGIR